MGASRADSPPGLWVAASHSVPALRGSKHKGTASFPVRLDGVGHTGFPQVGRGAVHSPTLC